VIESRGEGCRLLCAGIDHNDRSELVHAVLRTEARIPWFRVPRPGNDGIPGGRRRSVPLELRGFGWWIKLIPLAGVAPRSLSQQKRSFSGLGSVVALTGSRGSSPGDPKGRPSARRGHGARGEDRPQCESSGPDSSQSGEEIDRRMRAAKVWTYDDSTTFGGSATYPERNPGYLVDVRPDECGRSVPSGLPNS
jgi:hypothetical protein